MTIKLIEQERNRKFLIDNLLLPGGAISIHSDRQVSTSKVNVTELAAVAAEDLEGSRPYWRIHGMFTV